MEFAICARFRIALPHISIEKVYRPTIPAYPRIHFIPYLFFAPKKPFVSEIYHYICVVKSTK